MKDSEEATEKARQARLEEQTKKVSKIDFAKIREAALKEEEEVKEAEAKAVEKPSKRKSKKSSKPTTPTEVETLPEVELQKKVNEVKEEQINEGQENKEQVNEDQGNEVDEGKEADKELDGPEKTSNTINPDIIEDKVDSAVESDLNVENVQDANKEAEMAESNGEIGGDKQDLGNITTEQDEVLKEADTLPEFPWLHGKMKKSVAEGCLVYIIYDVHSMTL